jgi:predicted metalloprotease
MLLDGSRESSNVQDRRGGGGGVVRGGLGTLVLALVAMYFGVDPRAVIQPSHTSSRPANTAQDTKEKQFVSKVLASTEDVWHKLVPSYSDPQLVLFRGATESACGQASASVGPFYCGEDQKVYIDLDFYKELTERIGAPGDFAEAYVIAHEVGHHVQNELGTLKRVHALMTNNPTQKNQLSVRLELQADFYAGIWAHYAREKNLLEMGDIEEGLQAASAVGDDKLQKQGQGYVVPDSFTHGTSEQRMRWFKKGLESGDPAQGDTFNTNNL